MLWGGKAPPVPSLATGLTPWNTLFMISCDNTIVLKFTVGNKLEVEMKDLFTRYTNDVIATSAFGIGCDSLKDPKNEFYTLGKKFTNFSGIQTLKFLGFSLSPNLMKVSLIYIG